MYLIFITSILAFCILYFFVNNRITAKEDFTVCDRPNILDQWKKMIPYWNDNIHNPENYKLINKVIYSSQGTPIPLKPSKILLSNSEDIPTVEGEQNGPRSLAVFAYNKASPECCTYGNGGYSTSGGCICITPKQEKWFGDVAGNRRNGYLGF
jgi:hypothetical protein